MILFFMDIEMPEIDGWNTAKTYRIFYPESVVAMLTTHDEMCSKGYHINAILDLFQNKIWSMN